MADATVNGVAVTANEALALVKAQAEAARWLAADAVERAAAAVVVEDRAWSVKLAAAADAYLATGDAAALQVAVEVAHAERYPAGCPNRCEGCAARLVRGVWADLERQSREDVSIAPCRGCAVEPVIRTRVACEFCGGSGVVSPDA